MSPPVLRAMELLGSLCILVLLSVDVAQSDGASQGLVCVNDFVDKVSCWWTGAPLAPGLDCRISGLKRVRVRANRKPIPSRMLRSCTVKHHLNSPPGCSFVFENEKFNSMKDMPYICLMCNGTVMENLTNYMPNNHIKMNPPGVPNVSLTANETWIRWSAGSPRSKFLKSLDFQLEITEKNQTWTEANSLSPTQQELRIPVETFKGLCRVRVRVKPIDRPNSHWSDWSPTASWMGPMDVTKTPEEDQDWFLDWTSFVMWTLISSTGIFLLVTLVIYKNCSSKGLHKQKQVPNPSKYFHTLHSVHGGNLKKWLNPLSASESYFTAQSCDHISPVELCGSWDDVLSTSPSSISSGALLFPAKGCPSGGSDTSGVVDNSSSSSSSCFSNMGYFMSSSSGGSARTDPNPVYFTYQDDFHKLHPSLGPSLTSSLVYESLKREPLSPDSGFGVGEEEEKVLDAEEEDLEGQQSTPLLIFPLHLPPHMCPAYSPPPAPNAPSLSQVSPHMEQVEEPVAEASGSYTAWPAAGGMCRSSSMPVEPSKTGYLTLKELQSTFSNKSI